MGHYRDMNRYHDATAARYDGERVLQEYAQHLIDTKAYQHEWMDPGGASIYHVLFGGADHADEQWRDAFNYARRTPEYAVYLAREMNDCMFDDGFGDVAERGGPSMMCSAFANMMADHVLRLRGEQAAQDMAAGTVPPPGE